MLLNLAEDTAIERKMKKRNIVAYLVQASPSSLLTAQPTD